MNIRNVVNRVALVSGLALGVSCMIAVVSGCVSKPHVQRAGSEVVVGVCKLQAFIDTDSRQRSDAMVDALNSVDGISAFTMGAVDAASLAKLDVLIIPHENGSRLVNDPESKALIREWTRNGGGVMTTHDVVGYRGHEPLFPEIAYGTGNFYSDREPYKNRVCVSMKHPVTKNMELKHVFATAYFDYITLQPGPSGVVVLRGVEEAGAKLFSGAPALVAGGFGSGRYVACGLLLAGLAPRAAPELPIDGELNVLVNSVFYLGGHREFDPAGFEQDTDIGPSAFLAVVEDSVAIEDLELLPGVSIRKIMEGCEIPFEAEWKLSQGTPPPLDDVPDFTPVLSDEQYERCMAAEPYDRFPKEWERVDLNGEWKSITLPDTLDNPEKDIGTVQGFWKADFYDSAWTNTPVPTSVVPRLNANDFNGVNWFRRSFVLPDKPGSSYVLRFSGVKEEVRVYVNGREAGFHRGVGYPFEIDVTEAVKPGAENVFAIRNFGIARHRRYVNSIYDFVELHVRPEVYTRRILLNPVLEGHKLEMRVDIVNRGAKRKINLNAVTTPYVSVLADVEGERFTSAAEFGEVTLEPGMNTLEFTMQMDQPVYWSPENPALYEIALVSGSDVLGKERFGFREFVIDGRFFYLNGKRVNPVGMLLRDSMFMGFLDLILFPDNPGNVMQRRIMGYKNMNFNTLLTCRSQRRELFFDLCDEIGMMIYAINPRTWPPYNASPDEIWLWARAGREMPADIEVNADYIRDIKGTFRDKYHNRPSVVMSAVSTEWRNNVYQRSHLAGYEAVKSVDMQDRPVCATSGGAPSQAPFTFTDMEDFHIYPGAIGGHAFDHKHILIDSNLITWRYIGKNIPVINWEGLGAYMFVYNRNIDTARELWSQVPPDRSAIVDDIEGRSPGYHMDLATRWMSLYGIRRMVFDDYARGKDENRGVSSYAQEYRIKHFAIAARLVGDLYQGTGFNSGRFGDAFSLVPLEDGDDKATPFQVYHGPLYHLDRSGTLEALAAGRRIGTAHGFNQFRRYSNPALVCIDPTESKNMFAGGKYKTTVYAINDTGDDSGEWSVRAAVYDPSGKVVYDKTASIGSVPSFKRKLFPFEWSIPEKNESITYTLHLYLMDGGTVISDSSFDIHALGTSLYTGKVDAQGRNVALYDTAERNGFPELATAPVLDDMGLEYERIGNFNNLERFDVLLIGAAGMDTEVWRASGEISGWLESGGRMVVLEQEMPGQIAFLPRLSVVKKVGGSVVDMVDPRHPVFKDLQVNDYWNLWNGRVPTAEHYGREGGIYASLIGPLNHTVVATGVMDVPRATTKAVQMVMADVMVGEGMVFLSQAQAVRRYGKDSVATKYLRNVIEYAVSDITEFSAPLGEFSIGALDFNNFGFVDMSDAAKTAYKPDDEWREKVQEEGLSDLGDLRFIVESGNAAGVAAGERVSFRLPDRMKLMFPEREEQKLLKDVDQGTLNLQQFEFAFFLLGMKGGNPSGETGEIVFTYEDGTVERMKLVRGVNIDQSGSDPLLPEGIYAGNGFYVAKWVNPHLENKVTEIAVECSEQGAEILVGGITALLMREKIHD